MFGQNKKKTDYGARFQNRRFRQQLKDQRHYKRPKRLLPETAWGVFLSKIGLGTWLSRGITLLVFLLLIYLVYIPNIFFIKQVSVTGVSGQTMASVEQTVNNFLSKKTPWPQKNLLLTSKTALENYLAANNQSIWKVNGVNKKLPSTLIVSVSPRVDAFEVLAGESAFLLSNDGLITEELTATTATSSLAQIKLGNGKDLSTGKRPFSGEQMDYFAKLQNQLPDIIKTPINYFYLDDLQTPDLWVYTNSGFKLAFDLKSDPNEGLSRFKLLFSQISDSDAKRLYYIDMRFTDRGYICFKATACAQANTIQTASSSPSTIKQ